jgi:hypothetical protein
MFAVRLIETIREIWREYTRDRVQFMTLTAFTSLGEINATAINENISSSG